MIKRSTLSLLTATIGLLASSTWADTAALEHQVSDTLVRSAVSVIDYSQVLEGNSPLIVATTLLDAALELAPDNRDAWAMRVELARATPGTEDDEQALIKYLATGIRDDRASYDLIRLRLAKNNTLDSQLKALEQLLDSDAGRALEPALRSRLAMLASTMGKELLDDAAHRKWLIEAARTDPANAEAAQTLLLLVAELGGDDVRLGTAMINVVRSLPLEPGPRLQLAALLAQHGAYQAAAQQYEVVATRLSRQPLLIEDYQQWANCLVFSGQQEVALRLIEEFEAALNQLPADDEAQEAQAAEPAPLPLGLAFTRLALLEAGSQAAAKQKAEISAQLTKIQSQSEDASTKAEALTQQVFLDAIYHSSVDEAAQSINQYKQSDASIPWVVAAAEGWLAIRQGDTDKAKALLEPIADQHVLIQCGLAMTSGLETGGSGKQLQTLLWDMPIASPAALIAGLELKKLNQSPAVTKTGQALLNKMSDYPQSFWRIDLERTPWLAVRFTVDPARIQPLEPVTAEVTIWNATRFPIAIGENDPIQPSAVVLFNASTSGRAMPSPQPIVVDLKRRFSLKANERMTFTTRLDYHQFGVLRAANPGRAFVFDAKFIVNPWLTPAGLWVESGIGKSVDVRNGLVQARATSAAAVEDWLKHLDTGDATQKLVALQRLAGLSAESHPGVVTPELLAQVKPKLIEQWKQGDDLTRAWIIASAAPLDAEQPSFPELVELVKQSDSKVVWLSLLIHHARQPGSPLFSAAINRQDMPDVVRLGERMRRMMGEIQRFREQQQQLQEAVE